MYASTFWSPHNEIHIKRIESIPHKFFNSVAYKLRIPNPNRTHDYSEIATLTRLSTLESYRMYSDACVVYKIMNSLLNSPTIKSLFNYVNPTYTLGSTNTFVIPQHRTSHGYYSPITRLLRLGNEAKCPPLNVTTIDIFKRKARSVYLNQFV